MLGDVAVPGVKDCPIAGDKLPLIVFSHGRRGSLRGHHDTAETLADAGFVVAAINHPGDNSSDPSQTDDLSVLIERPADIKRLTDFMLGTWAEATKLDRDRIGFFGFSRGGYTGLVVIGGNPDFHAGFAYMCPQGSTTRKCEQIRENKIPAQPLTHDPRIKAAIIVDPIYAIGLTRGMGFATAAGCPGSDATTAACLRALSAPQILQLQGTANANGPYVTGPMVDGSVVPVTPITAWTTGQFYHVPVMGGNVQDEGNFGIGNTEYFTGPPQVPITATQYVANVTAAYSGPEYTGGPNYPAGTADQILAKYPPGPDPQATYDLVTTYPGACRNRHIDALWAQAGLPVYAYEFNDQNAPYYYPPMPGFAPLAAHTIDIQFLFPLWHGGILGVSGASQSPALTPQESILSSRPGRTSREPAIRMGMETRLGRDLLIRKMCLNTCRRTYPVCPDLLMLSSVPATTVTSGTRSLYISRSRTIVTK